MEAFLCRVSCDSALSGVTSALYLLSAIHQVQEIDDLTAGLLQQCYATVMTIYFVNSDGAGTNQHLANEMIHHPYHRQACKNRLTDLVHVTLDVGCALMSKP